ncbi:MAG: right-handed parallel beta-helix repeat-containing protein [Clostridiales bacterium]
MFNKKIMFRTFSILSFAIIIYFSLSSIFAGTGKEYYVSKTGDDDNSGNKDNPFETIQQGMDSLEAGDTLNIKEGIYNEKLEIQKSGEENNYITIKNYNDEKVIVDGSSKSGDTLVEIYNKSYIRIEGLELCNSNSGDTPAGIFIEGSGNGIQIVNNKIYNIKSNNNAHGIAVYGDNGNKSINNLILDKNEVYNCELGQSESIVINGNVENFEITNNIVHDNDNIGIDCIGFENTASSNDQARDGLVKGNYVYNISSINNPTYSDACAGGIYVDGGKDIVIENNRTKNCDIGIEVASEHKNKITENIIVRNNIVEDCGLYGISIGGAGSSNGYADNCIIINNTLFNNDVGINISKTKTNILKNNIVYGNTLLEGSVDSNEFSYNLGYSKKDNNSDFDMNKDPLFTDQDNGNFSLKDNSPAIDSGNRDDIESIGVNDYLGNERVVNSIVDLGAIEYGSEKRTDGEEKSESMIPSPESTDEVVVTKENEEEYKEDEEKYNEKDEEENNDEEEYKKEDEEKHKEEDSENKNSFFERILRFFKRFF